MTTCPYHMLMRYKRWATIELYDVIADNLARIIDAERVLILHLLDHIQTVDDIFRHHLETRAHDYDAPRSTMLSSLDALRHKAQDAADWYVNYADRLLPERQNDWIDFTFTDGTPGGMTRGEILLHIATHGTYHRGNIGIILQKNGIAPNADRMTDFLVNAYPDRLPLYA